MIIYQYSMIIYQYSMIIYQYSMIITKFERRRFVPKMTQIEQKRVP